MTDSMETIVSGIHSAIDNIKAQSAVINDTLKADLTKVDASAKEAIQAAEKAAKEVQSQASRIVELEQKLTAGVIAGKAAPKTLGQTVIQSDAFKGFAAGNTAKFRIEANTITGQEGSPPENSDTLVPTQRQAGIVPLAFRELRIRDVLPQGTATSNLYEYCLLDAFTNRAAETAEGDLKPETDMLYALRSAPIRTIAHIIKASRQVLDDAPALASFIDTQMRYGVDLRIDNALLNGNGTGQNISGMTDSGNFTAFTPTPGETALDSVNRAIYASWTSDYAPTGIIMNPADWGAIERIKGNDEHYVIGNPQGTIGRVLWGLPVVVSNTMTAGKFLLAAMQAAYLVLNRQGTVVEMYTQDEDNVQRNLVTILAEARLGLAVYRPLAVRYGDLVSTATA
jgi:HK97 family phage major capsid protein